MKYKISEYVPRVLPAGWMRIKPSIEVQKAYGKDKVAHFAGIIGQVILSLDDYEEGGMWLHMSISGNTGNIPNWESLKEAKEIFMGDRLAIQILPPKKYYINVLSNVLHLFSRLDAVSVPEVVWQQDTK